jgi:ATP-dependent protease ClpP protease subunit
MGDGIRYQAIHLPKVQSTTGTSGSNRERRFRMLKTTDSEFWSSENTRFRGFQRESSYRQKGQRTCSDPVFTFEDLQTLDSEDEQFWSLEYRQSRPQTDSAHLNVFGTLHDLDHPQTRRLISKLYELQSLQLDIDYLVITFSSYGGSTDTMFAIYNIIENLSCYTITIGNAIVASAAADLFLLGEQRYTYPNTTFMFHRGTISVPEINEYNLESYLENAKIQHAKLYEEKLFPLLNKEEQKAVMNGADLYIPAEKAVEYGIATNMIEEGMICEFAIEEN